MAPLLVTSTFLPLVEAQAKARRVTPRVIVVHGRWAERAGAGEKIEVAAASLLPMADGRGAG